MDIPALNRASSLVLAIAVAWLGGATARAGSDRPNILLIFADDIGYECLGCYGGLDFETPRLDAMAEDGLRFSRAYTTPVCTPSRVSMHTGLHVTRHRHTGVLPVHKGEDKIVDFRAMPTFAQFHRDAGYVTATTGKWQLATLVYRPGHIRGAGFDAWNVWQIWDGREKTLRHWNATLNENGRVLREEISDRFGPDVQAGFVIDEMRSAAEGGKPFLIVHNEMLPHWPVIDTPDDRAADRVPSLAGMIGYMDKTVGRLLDGVEELGIRDRTYVFFMGDNGTWDKDFANPRKGAAPGEDEHTRHTSAGLVNGGKAQHGDAGSHVPLLAWGPPTLPGGTTCDDLIDVVDLFPTFCELTGTAVPEGVARDGISFAAPIRGEQRPDRRTFTHQQFGAEQSIFDGEWRYSDKTGLWDARDLPRETPVGEPTTPGQTATRDRLRDLLGTLQ